MDDVLGTALAILLMVGGMALFTYAMYLQYVTLPGERDREHLRVRAALGLVGLVLVVLGTSALR